MRRPAQILVLLLIPWLGACSNSRNTQLIDYCSSGANFRGVVNGVVTNDYASIVPLQSSAGSCTGTVVSDSTVITAGHCVTTGSISYQGIYTSTIHSTQNIIDLAVAVFPPGTFGQAWARLLTRAPMPGDTIAVAGYGQTDFINNGRADGQKRIGCNTLVQFANVNGKSIQIQPYNGTHLFYVSPVQTYQYGAPGNNVMSGHGDSGGPILIDGRLAGVTNFGDQHSKMVSSYRISGDPFPGAEALYEFDTNLFSRIAVDFLRQAESQYGAIIPDLNDLDSAVGGSRGYSYY